MKVDLLQLSSNNFSAHLEDMTYLGHFGVKEIAGNLHANSSTAQRSIFLASGYLQTKLMEEEWFEGTWSFQNSFNFTYVVSLINYLTDQCITKFTQKNKIMKATDYCNNWERQCKRGQMKKQKWRLLRYVSPNT